MDKFQGKLENIDRLHKTKRQYLFALVCQCVLFSLLTTSYILSLITKDMISLGIVAPFMGIILCVIINQATMLFALKKRIIEETDKICEEIHEESRKMLMSMFEQIDKEFQEKKERAMKKAEENKAEADKKAEAEKKEPTKKVNATKGVQKKADPKKVSKKKN